MPARTLASAFTSESALANTLQGLASRVSSPREIGVGLVMPQSSAGAMGPFPDKAGAASSMLGITQMVFAALTGLLLAPIFRNATQGLSLPGSLAYASGATALAVISIAVVATFWLPEPDPKNMEE